MKNLNDAFTLYLRGKKNYDRGCIAEAAKDFRRVTLTDESNPLFKLRLAITYQQMNNLEASNSVAFDIIHDIPENEYLNCLLAQNFYRSEEYATGDYYFRRFKRYMNELREEYHNGDLFFYDIKARGEFMFGADRERVYDEYDGLVRKGDYRKAEKLLDDNDDFLGDDIRKDVSRAWIYALTDDSGRMNDCCDRILEKDETNPDATYLRGLGADDDPELREMLCANTLFKTERTNSQAVMNSAVFLNRHGKHKEAAGLIAGLDKRIKGNYALSYMYAAACYNVGNYREASSLTRELYDIYGKIYPSDLVLEFYAKKGEGPVELKSAYGMPSAMAISLFREIESSLGNLDAKLREPRFKRVIDWLYSYGDVKLVKEVTEELAAGGGTGYLKSKLREYRVTEYAKLTIISVLVAKREIGEYDILCDGIPAKIKVEYPDVELRKTEFASFADAYAYMSLCSVGFEGELLDAARKVAGKGARSREALTGAMLYACSSWKERDLAKLADIVGAKKSTLASYVKEYIVNGNV